MAIYTKIDDPSIKRLLDDFLYEIQTYLTKPKYSANIDSICIDGLSVFKKLPFVNSASVFLLDDETYDFEHIKTIPERELKVANRIFDKFIDNKIIDSSYEQGSIFIQKTFEESDYNIILVPMIVSWGIIGVVVIHIDMFETDYLDNFSKVCGIHGRIFASVIERKQLFDKLKSSNEYLSNKIRNSSIDLNQSRQEFHDIFNHVPVGILLIQQEDYSIYMANPKALDMLEAIDEDALIGKRFQEISDQLNIKVTDKSFDFKLIGLMGRKQEVTCLAKPTIINNESMFIISFLRNELKEETVTELEKSLNNERTLSKVKMQFMNNVSHEFLTPLTVIRSSVQLLDNYDDKMSDLDKSKHFDSIYKMIEHMGNLISNSIVMTGSEPELDPKMMNFKLEEFISSTADKLKYSLNRKNKIILDIKPRDLEINYYPKALKNIFKNMISNCLKFSKQSDDITIKVSKFNKELMIEFIDNGIGIPSDSNRKIFEPFFRGSNVGSITGVGLGLSVVKKYVDLVEGDISYTSKENETRFLISLPLISEK